MRSVLKNNQKKLKNIEPLKRKLLLNEKNVSSKIDYCIELKIPFIVKVSNYTVNIETPFENIHYLKGEMNKNVFAAYSKIRKDTFLNPITIDEKFIKYYQTGFIYDKLYLDKIYQIDIKSCYATVLKNSGIITSETYDFVGRLHKKQRLASVGMLASRKNVFQFNEDGKIVSHETVKNETSDYFFYCVQETFKLMDNCKRFFGNSFLFSWVDAIYTGSDENIYFAIEFLNSIGFSSTLNILTDFEVELRENFYRLRYKKEGEPHYMNIPLFEQAEKKHFINYLLNKKYEV